MGMIDFNFGNLNLAIPYEILLHAQVFLISKLVIICKEIE